jgi:hypothetical protein
MVARGPPKTEVEGSSPLRVVFLGRLKFTINNNTFSSFQGGFKMGLKFIRISFWYSWW